MKKILLGSLVGAILFTGCIGSSKTEAIEIDKFSGLTKIISDTYMYQTDTENLLSLENNLYRCMYRAIFKTKSDLNSIQLYCMDTSKSWNFPDYSIGEDQYNYEITSINREVSNIKYGGVFVEEHWLINIPMKQFKNITQKDYQLKIYNKKAVDMIFTLPKEDTNKFLNKIQNFK